MRKEFITKTFTLLSRNCEFITLRDDYRIRWIITEEDSWFVLQDKDEKEIYKTDKRLDIESYLIRHQEIRELTMREKVMKWEMENASEDYWTIGE